VLTRTRTHAHARTHTHTRGSSKFLAFLQAHSLNSIISRLDQICPPANTAQQSTVPSSPKPSLKKEKSQPSILSSLCHLLTFFSPTLVDCLLVPGSPAEETLHQEKKVSTTQQPFSAMVHAIHCPNHSLVALSLSPLQQPLRQRGPS